MQDPENLPLCKPLESIIEAELVAERHSAFQRVQIFHHPNYGHQLVIDGDLQISESDTAYNTAMVAPLLTLSQCRDIAILGGGDGGVLQEALNSLAPPQGELQKATMIEIDPTVIDLCRRYMPSLNSDCFTHPCAEVQVGDAFAFIEQARNLDGVIYDLTMDPVREDQQRGDFIEEILGNIAQGLRPGGIVSMQCCGQYEEDPDKEQDRQTLLEQIRFVTDRHFQGVIEQQVYIPSFHEMWTFIAAVKPPVTVSV